MIGLPPVFLHEHGIGGGVIQVKKSGRVDHGQLIPSMADRPILSYCLELRKY